jgi:pre-mRNA-splicing factor ISY1
MARNQEKAQAMLNRYLTGKEEEAKGFVERRPFKATEVTNVGVAEKWRRQLVSETALEVSKIQNGSMGEHKVRDMNDRINKLIRERTHWERQIAALGGVDYAAQRTRVTDSDGAMAMGENGYYYFGAAKELPGVRELFERQMPAKKKRTRAEMYKVGVA